MPFRLKTILGIAAIEILLLGILVVGGLGYIWTSNEALLVERARTAARLFASMTSDAVIASDLASLDSLIVQTLKNPGFVYLRVRDASGKAIAEGGEKLILSRPFVEHVGLSLFGSGERLDVAHPIEAGGAVFGSVELGISAEGVEGTIFDALSWMSRIALAEIALVAIFGFVLGTILTRQLLLLREGARRVAAGAFGHTIEVHGSDEIADTAKSFNAMSTALSEYAARLEASLAAANERRLIAESTLADAVESMPEGIAILDPEGKIVHVNSAFLTMHSGAAAGAALDDSERLGAKADEGMPVEIGGGRTVIRRRRPMSRGGTVVAQTDVTELRASQELARQLERELEQVSKLESLGTLAGGIAHEINTPMQFIGDNLTFLKSGFESLSVAFSTIEKSSTASRDAIIEASDKLDLGFLMTEIPSAIEQAREGVETVSRIVRAVKAFSYSYRAEKSPQDIAEAIQTTLVVSRNQWKYAAEIVTEFDPTLSTVPCNPGEINQVILNLIVNAAHAIEDRKDGKLGRITIMTKAVGDMAEIRVSDTGVGIAPDNLVQIFDPFFTTKAPGRGTGQGLSIAYNIVVKSHGGRIFVNSELGTGSTFIVLLPLRAIDSIALTE